MHEFKMDGLADLQPDFALITDMAIHAEGSAFKALIAVMETMPQTRAFDKVLALHVAIGLMKARVAKLEETTSSTHGGNSLLRLAEDVRKTVTEIDNAHSK